MSCEGPNTSNLSFIEIFGIEIGNLLKGSAFVFLGCEIPIRIVAHIGGKAGAGLTFLIVSSALIYLYFEDNLVWNDRTLGQFISYFIIIVICHLTMMVVAHSFIEQVTEFTGKGILPVTHIRLKDVDSWSWSKSASFHIFEWFLTFYFLVAFLTLFKFFYILCACIFDPTYGPYLIP